MSEYGLIGLLLLAAAIGCAIGAAIGHVWGRAEAMGETQEWLDKRYLSGCPCCGQPDSERQRDALELRADFDALWSRMFNDPPPRVAREAEASAKSGGTAP